MRYLFAGLVVVVSCVGYWVIASGARAQTRVESRDTAPVVVVRVIDAKGRPIPGARVGERRTGPAGVCELRLDEETSLAVSCDGYCPARITIERLASSARLERWVRLERGRDLALAVQLEDGGRPAAGAHVRLDLIAGPVDADSPRVAVANEEGTVQFQNVPNGRLELAVVPPGYWSTKCRLELVEGRPLRDHITLTAHRATHLAVALLDSAHKTPGHTTVFVQGDDLGKPAATVVTDGEFHADVPAGSSVSVAAFGPAWTCGWLTFTSDGRPKDSTTLVLISPAAHPDANRLHVAVVDSETKAPIEGAHVTVEFRLPVCHWPITSDECNIDGMDTGPDGLVVMQAVPFSEATVYATCHGYEEDDGGIHVSRAGGELTATVCLSRLNPARRVTCRASRPVDVFWMWQRERPDGAIELEGFDAEDETTDIHYAPRSEFRRDCVVRGVPLGTHGVELPLYDTGDIVVHCVGPEGPLPRACIAVESTDFSGAAWKADARGEMLLRDVPTGTGSISVFVWGREVAGPISYSLRRNERVEVEAVLGQELGLLDVHLALDDGTALAGCRVYLADADGTQIEVVPEPFWDPVSREPPVLQTLSNGRCYVPVPPQSVTVAFQTTVHSAPDLDWMVWNGALFGFVGARAELGKIVDLDLQVERHVCVSSINRSGGAYGAGFRAGDTIVTWNGCDVHHLNDCAQATDRFTKVTVRRGGEIIELAMPPGQAGIALDWSYTLLR